MSFAAGGQGTEAQPRHRHCQGTLGTRQSKPREIVSVGERKPPVAVAARKATLSVQVTLYGWITVENSMFAKPVQFFVKKSTVGSWGIGSVGKVLALQA